MDTSKIKKKLRETTLLKKSSKLYQRHKRFTPLISFTAGFAWDTFTLSRIDLWRDNLIMLAYLLFLGVFIVLVNFIQDKLVKNKYVLNYAEWYPLIIQFLLGGLFSKYVIFYFQSATLSKNWLFILLLVVILIGNEFIRDRLSSLKFQALLYFLASFETASVIGPGISCATFSGSGTFPVKANSLVRTKFIHGLKNFIFIMRISNCSKFASIS